MKHPEILLLPILMFADHFLTILSVVEKEKRFAKHIKVLHDELNPLWQKSVAQKRWFNPRHILLTLIITTALVSVSEFFTWDAFSEGTLGALFTIYGVIVGSHLSNIATYRYVSKRTGEISGEVTFAHAFVLRMSAFGCLSVGFPFLILALFVQTPYVIGGLLGILWLFFIHSRWLRQWKNQPAWKLGNP